MTIRSQCFPVAVLGLALARFCLGQAGRAELFGTIQDPSGLPILKAKVAAEDQATMIHYEAVTDERGEYHILGLPASQYLLTVEQPGFRMYRQTGIVLQVGDRSSLNIQMQIGQPTQTIDVVAGTTLLQTDSGEVSFHADDRKVSTLPLDGRNFVPLTTLSPGVALPTVAPGATPLPRINGSRPRTNEYMYDGISVLQPEPGQVVYYPVVDGIEEFKLNVNSYSPEYGRSNGGTIMVIGKSGGNQFHGDLFEFFRNDAIAARNLFNFKPNPVLEYRRNQYGFTAGGPIQKNKTFFFVDWQGSRQRLGLTRFSVVPTDAQRLGNFTQQVFDPLSSPRTAFVGNMVPLTRWDSIGKQILAHYPAANTTGANNFVRTAVEPDDQDQGDIRIDRYFGEKHRVFARYSQFRDDDAPVTPLPDGSGSLTAGVIGHAVTRGDSIAADYNWTLSSTMLNQLRFGYSRRDLDQASLQNGGIAIPGLPANSFASVLPIFTVTGLAQIGPTTAANSKFTTSITEYLDTFTMLKGRHTLKFGVDLRREALDVLNPPNPTGSFAFTTTGTDSPTATGGNALASLLLGQVNAFTIDIQNNVIQPRAHIAELFAGDEWKVTPRLSLSYGTRYTLNFPSTEKNDQGAVFNLNTQVLDFVHTARKLAWGNFGPRLGLAYRLSNNWVVRSGYGMVFFEQSGITTPFTIPQFPFVQTVGQQSQDNINAAFTLSNGPTVQVTPPNPNSGLGQGVFGVDSNNGSGYSQQWNFTVQRTFGKDWNLEVGYLGSKNTRLGIPDPNLNQLPAQFLSMGTAALTAKVANPFFGIIPASSSLGQATIAQQQLLRPYPRFTTLALFRDNVGFSTYNAATARLEKRFSRGLTVTAAYTFSKLLDDASSVFSQTIFTGPILGSTGAADAYNRHLEKDVSSGDIPRIFSMSWVYDIPKLWKVSGWQLAGVVRIQAGDAVPVTQATNNLSAFGFAVQRPNRIGDPNDIEAPSTNKWFNTAAFANAGTAIGNSSRDPVRGPGIQNADLMVGKTFRINERMKFEFRAECFNVSNTPAFNDPNGSFGNAAFGTIIIASNPRSYEFVGKIHF